MSQPSARDFRQLLAVLLIVARDALSRVKDLPASNDPLARLSPRKSDKHVPGDEHARALDALARRAVAGLLAVRIADVVGGPALFATLNTPQPSPVMDEATIFDISRRLQLAVYTGSPVLASPAVHMALAGAGMWGSIANMPDALFSPTFIAVLPQTLAAWANRNKKPGSALRKRVGIFHTPAPLARRLADLTLAPLLPQVSINDDETQILNHEDSHKSFLGDTAILDPACGGGSLLLAAFEVLCEGGVAPLDALACLYGVDLDPIAVDMTRLALARSAQIAAEDRPLDPATLAAIWARIRPGHALISACDLAPLDYLQSTHIYAIRAVRTQLLAPPDDKVVAPFAVLAELDAQEAILAVALEPILARLALNAPDEWRALAAATPFNWPISFPEVSGFAAVLANPPFVGFNDYSGIEKALYARSFPQVYNLKSDLLYYFLARGVGLLRTGGRLGYITSRFWQAAAHAKRLRAFLSAETDIEVLTDLDPASTLFEGAQIDACLLVATKAHASKEGKPFSAHGIAVIGAQTDDAHVIAQIRAASVPLSEVAECCTGVQTGCDAAFMLTPEQSRALPPELVRPALKNADVGSYRLDWAGRAMLYVDTALLAKEGLADATETAVWQRWPDLAAHLAAFGPRLATRRRYAVPFPPYLPQWPRRRAIFEAVPKLVTPYKAPFNTFALDHRGFFFSTDVVAVVPRLPYASEEWLYGLLAVLNCRVATFYFRSYAKKVGGGQYDYYANPLKQLPVPREPDPATWQKLSALARSLSTGSAYPCPPSLPASARAEAFAEIDTLTCALFGLNPATIERFPAHQLIG